MKLPPSKFIFVALIFLLIPIGIWSFLIEPDQLVVKQYSLPLQRWSKQLNGLKIVAISDLHAGSNFITESKIRQIVELSNAENPDLVVLLGDYLSPTVFDRTNVKMSPETMVENLRGLKPRLGTFVVMGNHDNEFGSKRIRYNFEKLGYTVLEDELATVDADGQKLRILGTYDALRAGNEWARTSAELKERLNRENPDDDLIVLTHNPDAIFYLTETLLISEKFSLLIAGHTHGGQCRFPLIGAPIIPSENGQKYAAGFVHDRGIDLFVTTGIGTSILPVRFGVPPEISVLRLYAE